MNRVPETALTVLGGALLTTIMTAGCSTPEVSTSRAGGQVAIRRDSTARPPGMEFTTLTDTVALSEGGSTAAQPDSTQAPPAIRFMVQVGAFRDPRNASTIQLLTRDRYRLPVLNDYHTQLQLYQIRVGFFENREAAAAFLQRMQAEYPEDYRDSWVVQLAR